MTTSTMWPWAALLLLGATHGINPGMGWLLAVGLGLQQRDRRAVLRALAPLAAGHALAMGAALVALAAIGAVVAAEYVRWFVAVALIAVATRSLLSHRHPRWGGMRMGARDLTAWSFLMASAHGAGLMALPFVLRLAAVPVPANSLGHAHSAHGSHVATAAIASSAPPLASIGAVMLHTVGYLTVTAFVAVIVYDRLGLRLLRTMWVNVDVIWAFALIAMAVLAVAL